MASETPVEILLQFDSVALNEVKLGKPQPIVESAELIVVSFVPTEAQVETATRELGLPPGSIVTGDGTPLVFVFVGEYKIPVNRSIPVIQAGLFDFTFVLPNALFLQVLLPPETDAQEADAFEHILFSYGLLKKKPAPSAAAAVASAPPLNSSSSSRPSPKISTRIAIGLGKVTRVAAAGITKGAELLSHGVNKGTDKIVEVTEPCREAVKVSDSTKAHVNRARVATKGIATMSGTVATAMIGVTAVMGNFIGKRIANRVSSAEERDGTTDRLAAVKEVGGAAIGCVGVLFDAATDAGRQILSSSCQGIAKVVTHKLGEEAGQTTANGLGVVTDVVDIGVNMRRAGIRGVVAATAQSSAMSMIDELDKKHDKDSHAA